jgi:hypothetical protein
VLCSNQPCLPGVERWYRLTPAFVYPAGQQKCANSAKPN